MRPAPLFAACSPAVAHESRTGAASAGKAPLRLKDRVILEETAARLTAGHAQDRQKLCAALPAEVWLEDAGWFAINPADMRKVMLEERRGLEDPRIVALSDRLFGYAEGDWAAYNSRRDLVLPGTTQSPRYDFLMYPTAITADRVLGAEALSYTITARPVAA